MVSENDTSQKQNWLALDPWSKEFAQEALQRFTWCQQLLRATRSHWRMMRSWMMYYSRSRDTGVDETEVNFAGDKNEIVLVKPNRFRRLLQNQLTLVRSTPPNYEPVALNTDPESQSQCRLALSILEHYKRSAHMVEMRNEQAEMATVLSLGVKHVRWNARLGRQIGQKPVQAKDDRGEPMFEEPTPDAPEDQPKKPKYDFQPVYEGDLEWSVRSRYDVAWDPTSRVDRSRWWIVREPYNRWDAVEQWGGDSEEIRNAILNAPKWSKYTQEWGYEKTELEYDDSIGIYYVYADRSPSLPDGLRVLLIEGDAVLEAGPLDEDRPGVFPLFEALVMFKPETHTGNFDGMPIQQLMHAQMSVIASNHDAHGLRRVIGTRESGIKASDLDTGVKLIDYQGYDQQGRPNPPPAMMSLDDGDPGLIEFYQMLAAELDLVLRDSPVMRGEAGATRGDSGSKDALLYAAAQRVGSQFVDQVRQVDADEATFVISSLKRHASSPRIIAIVGESQETAVKEYKSEDLQHVDRVLVRPADPSRDTYQGRSAMLDKLYAPNVTPQARKAMLAFMFTGRIDNETEEDDAKRMLIVRENADLRDPAKASTPPPQVAPWDDHREHYKCHSTELDDPTLRNDPNRFKRAMTHMQWHVEALTLGHPNCHPEILQMTGQEPIGGGAPQGQQQQPNGKPAAGGPKPEPQQGGNLPEAARQPVNPATGQRAPLQGPPQPNV